MVDNKENINNIKCIIKDINKIIKNKKNFITVNGDISKSPLHIIKKDIGDELCQ